MTVSATSSPVVLLGTAVEPAKAAAPATANASGDAGAGEFQQLLAQAAEGAEAPAGLVLLTGKTAAQGSVGAKVATDAAAESGNALPLLTDLLPPAPVAPATTDSDAKLEADSAPHKKSDDQTDQTDSADQAVTLLTLPVQPPLPVVPANTVAAPVQAAVDDAQAAALSAAQSVAALPKGVDTGADTTDEIKGETKGETKGAAARAAAVNAGDALAVAATTTKSSAPTTAADLAVLNAAGGDGANAQGDRNNADFAGVLKQLDGSTAVQSSGTVDTSRAVQQADRAYQQSAPQGSPATATVSLPVASDGWHDAVADKVVWFGANKITSAEIHLNPPDLGPIQVHISTDRDQASVYFTSQHASVREALDQALPRLREMMGGQGIQLANAGVGGQGSSPQQQQDYRGNSEGRSRPQFDGLLRDMDDGAEPIGVSGIATARLARSGIDAYA